MTLKQNRRGFTIIEIIIAIMVLTVGLLGLVTTAALVTRMIARGQRSAVATAFASRRLERLRVSACTSQTPGTDTLYRGSQWVAVNTWSFTTPATQTYRLKIVTKSRTTGNKVRTDSTETTIPCNVFG